MQLFVQVLRYLATRKAEQQQQGWKLPAVHHAPGFLRYSHASAGTHAHEAGCAHMLCILVSRLRQGLVSWMPYSEAMPQQTLNSCEIWTALND